MRHSHHHLSNLQQELLKLFSSDIDEKDLLHIKTYLGNYFAQKAIQEADKIWDKNTYSNDTMKQWLNEDDVFYSHQCSYFELHSKIINES
ncbi:MAG TPA: hypothetical protein PL009_13375 [Flavipsychrobacter sp.]|nr:hypothetical protein [Flavipsychrobacter sp.]